MTPAELTAALAALFPEEGKGQSAAARFLGIDGRTVRRYLAGELAIPTPTAKLFGYMVAAGITPAELDAALARPRKKRRRQG